MVQWLERVNITALTLLPPHGHKMATASTFPRRLESGELHPSLLAEHCSGDKRDPSNPGIVSTFQAGKRQIGEGAKDSVDESDLSVRRADTFPDSLKEKLSPAPKMCSCVIFYTHLYFSFGIWVFDPGEVDV